MQMQIHIQIQQQQQPMFALAVNGWCDCPAQVTVSGAQRLCTCEKDAVSILTNEDQQIGKTVKTQTWGLAVVECHETMHERLGNSGMVLIH
jgi:hypothetical protein